MTECLKERKRGLSASFINFKLFLEFIDSELPISWHQLIKSDKHGTMKAYTKIMQGGKENEKK